MIAPAPKVIAAFLRERPAEPWCSECVARKCDLARSRAANVFLVMEGMTGFRRLDRPCNGCGHRRLALMYSPHSPTPSSVDGPDEDDEID